MKNFQCFGSWFIDSGSGSGSSIWSWIPIWIQGFDDYILTKLAAEKKNIFWPKIAIYLSLGRHKGYPSYRRSLQPPKSKHPALQNMKVFLTFFYFCGSFLPSGYGYGSTDLIESGSNPDPKHWKIVFVSDLYRHSMYIRLFITLVKPLCSNVKFYQGLIT